LFFARKVQRHLADRIPFIVNDRVDIACLSGASGVHVGQDDLPVAEARKILGRKKIVGTSCQTLGHIRRAVEDGADYIGFGSVFRTLTKPGRSPMDFGLLKQAVRAAQRARVPLFAIGGIGQNNLPLVTSCGVKRVAVCRDILLAEDVHSSVGELRRRIEAA
jgi:thiamine-phosphate pyrophosphorylase